MSRRPQQKPQSLIGNAHFAAPTKTSWWVGLDRDELTREASAQLPRMRNSRYGQLDFGPVEAENVRRTFGGGTAGFGLCSAKAFTAA